MNTPILSSTFFLTLLLFVGLFFFIRASVKDRTQQVQLQTELTNDDLLPKLKQYFAERAYKVTSVEENQVKFEGFVRPSWFLAIFLMILAACGLLCLSLILSFLYPSLGSIFLLLVLLAPLTGVFYWKKAGRLEEVLLKVESISDEKKSNQSLITLRAHRDEILQFKQLLPFKSVEE